MSHPTKVGISFGLTSAVITTLGLIVGLFTGTHSKVAVLGGILTIAVADALSDAFGIHMSEESERKHTPREIWKATFSTFLSKFVFALTFIVPFVILEMHTAVVASVVMGFLMITGLSYGISSPGKRLKAVVEHLLITTLVVLIAYLVGLLVASF